MVDADEDVLADLEYGADGLDNLPAEGMIDPLIEDMKDPVDMLLAMTEDPTKGQARPLDFVRSKFKDMKTENKRLRERVADLEQTLSIVQTAQEWTVGKGMTQEQAEKMREIKTLLEQAKQARADMQNFSQNSKAALYEKLRSAKIALRKEREEKREMKERLLNAFEASARTKESYQLLLEQHEMEKARYEAELQRMRERYSVARFDGDMSAMQPDSQEQATYFPRRNQAQERSRDAGGREGPEVSANAESEVVGVVHSRRQKTTVEVLIQASNAESPSEGPPPDPSDTNTIE